MHIFVTGGAGFIGSHTCLELLEAGYNVTVLDNFSNSNALSLTRVETLTGRPVTLVHGDIRDSGLLQQLFTSDTHKDGDFDAVIHFAGLKSVSESVANPLDYYDNNVNGTACLLRAMSSAGIKRLIFSSSATVYGDPASVPITENFPRSTTNPYGRSKLIIEHMLEDLYSADPAWQIARLRYFNPVGAHPSGQIGEDPYGVPNNLMPFINQVAIGRREFLSVFGGDYPTGDGTGVRDYIHVVDLAKGHLAALRVLTQGTDGRLLTVNLGTGRGVSVLELVRAFEQASGRKVPYRIVARRPGDVAECYSDPTLATQELGWRAELDIDEMCQDAWRWQSQNPNGFSLYDTDSTDKKSFIQANKIPL